MGKKIIGSTSFINEYLQDIVNNPTEEIDNFINVYNNALNDNANTTLIYPNFPKAEYLSELQNKTSIIDNKYKAGLITKNEAINQIKVSVNTTTTSYVSKYTVDVVAVNYLSWIWGASDSEGARPEHALLYGNEYDSSNQPEELPKELPNCKCEMLVVERT